MSSGNASLTPDPNESRTSTILAVVPTVLAVAATPVILRVYTRAIVVRHFGCDDVLAVVSFILTLACGLCVAWNTRYGFGRHVETVDPSDIPLYLRTFYYSIVLYNAALMAIKMTFLTQYYRVLAVRGMKRIFITAIVLIGCWSLSQLLVEIFICTPIHGFWDKSIQATCIPNYPQWYINAAGNIITDFIIFVLPLPVIGKLELPRAQKMTLMAIFSLGFFTCIISLVRIKFLKLTEDYTWDNIESAGWSVGELCSGITCACLPTLRPLFAKVWPAMRTQHRSSVHSKKTSWSDRTNSTASPDLERGRPGPDDDETRWRHVVELGSPESFHFGRHDSDVQSPDSFHYGAHHSQSPPDEPIPDWPLRRPAPVRTIQRVKEHGGA